MREVWLTVLLIGAFTIALKASGPVLYGGRELPSRVADAFELLAPSLLAALVVTQALGEGGELVVDERLVGVGVAAVAVRLRAHLIIVMVLAAVSTAIVRWAF
jgi:branched-subunit amino acid transport protein